MPDSTTPPLVDRLRDLGERFGKCRDQATAHEAADRIEQLERELADARGIVARVANFPDLRGKRSQDARDMQSIARTYLERNPE